MKKVLIRIVILLTVSFNFACSDCPDCDSECTVNCCSDQADNGLSEILIVVSPNWFNGFNANIMIWADENRTQKVVDDSVTITLDGQVFSYELEPGDYWLNIMGEGFTSYKYFYLPPDDSTAINVELLDDYTVEWILDYRNDSPTTGTVSPETHLLWFELSQNWLEMLYLQGLVFHIENPGNAVTIESCKLQFYTLAGWRDVSTPVSNICPSGYCNYIFDVSDQTLDPYLYIHPNSPYLYALSCDVSAAQPGAVVKAYNLGFGFKNSYLLPFSVTVSPEYPEVTF